MQIIVVTINSHILLIGDLLSNIRPLGQPATYAPATIWQTACHFMWTSVSLAKLLVADPLHPVDVPAVERLLDGNMRHGRRRRRTVPMLEGRRKPHDIARPHL